mmetsp:Transcript_55134/g.145534  ORF Transcript_55134/g.145534 Transcript_55134/m.145534 type:complete len:201 (-) Transcript_55134:342-944(-)
MSFESKLFLGCPSINENLQQGFPFLQGRNTTSEHNAHFRPLHSHMPKSAPVQPTIAQKIALLTQAKQIEGAISLLKQEHDRVMSALQSCNNSESQTTNTVESIVAGREAQVTEVADEAQPVQFSSANFFSELSRQRKRSTPECSNAEAQVPAKKARPDSPHSTGKFSLDAEVIFHIISHFLLPFPSLFSIVNQRIILYDF